MLSLLSDSHVSLDRMMSSDDEHCHGCLDSIDEGSDEAAHATDPYGGSRRSDGACFSVPLAAQHPKGLTSVSKVFFN